MLSDLDQLMVEKWEQSDQTLWALNQIIYAGARAAYQKQTGMKKMPSKVSLKERVEMKEGKVTKARAVLGMMTAELVRREGNRPPTKRQERNIRLLKLNGITKDQLRKRIAQQKELLQVKTHQARQLKERMAYKTLNNQFSKQSVACLKGKRKGKRKNDGAGGAQPATSDEFREFWTNVIGVEGEYRPEHEALLKWTADMATEERPTFPPFSAEIWGRVIKRCKSWKAPGPDGVQGFWLKAFPGMTAILGERLWKAIKHPRRIEQWLVRGRTVLIPKDGCTGKPHQYRPITCLNVMYKLMTAIVTEVLYHLPFYHVSYPTFLQP